MQGTLRDSARRRLIFAASGRLGAVSGLGYQSPAHYTDPR
jgi:hypothetical protein